MDAPGNRSRYLGTQVLLWCLAQSYLGTGSKVVHDDTLVSVHTSSRATGLAPGEGRVWHTHSREVAGGGKQQSTSREATQQGFLSQWNK